MPSVERISTFFLPLLALCQPSLSSMIEGHQGNCCRCRTALEPRCGNTEMCCGIGTGFKCTQWEYFEHICYNKDTGEFFTPDKSSGNAYTSVLVYSDSTQELFEVENTQSDTAKAVKLRPRGDIEEPEASPCLDEGDLISYPSDPTITEGPESPGYPEESVYPVESEQSKEPSHPNTLEEYEYPKKPMYLDKPEETGMPEESWTCVDTATNVNESDGCENTPTIPSATKEIDIPNSLKTDLPILPPVVTSHSTSFPNSTVFVTYSPYKPSAKETSKGPVSISTTTPSSPSDAKPTSSKDAKTTSNVSTTAVPDVPGMAVTVLAPAGGLAFCILLGLSFVA